MTQTTPSSVDAMREAKPCQKCGGKGFPRQSGDGDVEWLQCCSCGHEGPLRYSLTEAVAAWNATLPSDGVTIPADDGGEAITDAAKRMVAVQGMDWAELDGGDIGYWESLAAVALAAPKAPPVAQAEGVEITADLLGEVMQDAWGEICQDANAHPLDMRHGRGTVLFYTPHHWTSLIAMRLNERLAALSATTEQGERE